MRDLENLRRWRKKWFKDPAHRARKKKLYKNWMANHPFYVTYNNAKRRCEELSNREYPRYGARGIEFRFKSYNDFISALGPRPDGKTLDRVDNNGHYEVGNVRWATPSEQAFNRRRKGTL